MKGKVDMNVILSVEGMSCSACSSSLEKYLKKQNGVVDASVNLVLATANITYSEELTITDLERFIKEAGYKSLGIYSPDNSFKELKLDKKLFITYTILAIYIFPCPIWLDYQCYRILIWKSIL